MACLAGKARGQKRRDEVERQSRANDTGTQADHVHVVVLNRLVRGVGVMADSGADAGKLAGGNRYAGAAAAHDDPALGLLLGDRRGHRFCGIGVINGRR